MMATQGILSIVSEHGGTQIKAVAGSNGMDVPKAAKAIKKLTEVNIRTVFDACVGAGMATLVVMDKKGNVLVDEWAEVDGRLPELYYSEFHNPSFNPRWSNGTAEYVEMVTV